MTLQKSNKAGFTLIELSIVLVIIGLIVGGVLVGQDLIKAATIRASVAQVEKTNTAINTFYNKYNGLPGDLVNATNYFTGVLNSNEAQQGDGDRLIEGTSAANTACTATMCIAGESAVMWYMLSQAGLVSENITSNDYEVFNLTVSDTVLPQTKMGRGARMAIMSIGGVNYMAIANYGTAALAAGTASFTQAMSPLDALQFDSKLDDGSPITGSVRSIAVATALPGANANGAATANIQNGTAVGACYDSTLNIYATNGTSSVSNGVGCNLGIQASF